MGGGYYRVGAGMIEVIVVLKSRPLCYTFDIAPKPFPLSRPLPPTPPSPLPHSVSTLSPHIQTPLFMHTPHSTSPFPSSPHYHSVVPQLPHIPNPRFPLPHTTPPLFISTPCIPHHFPTLPPRIAHTRSPHPFPFPFSAPHSHILPPPPCSPFPSPNVTHVHPVSPLLPRHCPPPPIPRVCGPIG